MWNTTTSVKHSMTSADSRHNDLRLTQAKWIDMHVDLSNIIHFELCKLK